MSLVHGRENGSDSLPGNPFEIEAEDLLEVSRHALLERRHLHGMAEFLLHGRHHAPLVPARADPLEVRKVRVHVVREPVVRDQIVNRHPDGPELAPRTQIPRWASFRSARMPNANELRIRVSSISVTSFRTSRRSLIFRMG